MTTQDDIRKGLPIHRSNSSGTITPHSGVPFTPIFPPINAFNWPDNGELATVSWDTRTDPTQTYQDVFFMELPFATTPTAITVPFAVLTTHIDIRMDLYEGFKLNTYRHVGSFTTNTGGDIVGLEWLRLDAEDTMILAAGEYLCSPSITSVITNPHARMTAIGWTLTGLYWANSFGNAAKYAPSRAWQQAGMHDRPTEFTVSRPGVSDTSRVIPFAIWPK